MPKKSKITRIDKESLIALSVALIGLVFIIESLNTMSLLYENSYFLSLPEISITTIYIILKVIAGVFAASAGLIFLKRK
jgi:hypothetical protein